MQGAGWTVQNGRVGVIKTLTIKVVKQKLQEENYCLSVSKLRLSVSKLLSNCK